MIVIVCCVILWTELHQLAICLFELYRSFVSRGRASEIRGITVISWVSEVRSCTIQSFADLQISGRVELVLVLVLPIRFRFRFRLE